MEKQVDIYSTFYANETLQVLLLLWENFISNLIWLKAMEGKRRGEVKRRNNILSGVGFTALGRLQRLQSDYL